MSQYIGARYVPKFMGTYNNTQAYENMVVVDNGMGTSYISKVPVPAGTPLTDTNYWALYGASNGAIINLQNQIDAINDELPNSIDNIPTPQHGIVFMMDSFGGNVTPNISTLVPQNMHWSNDDYIANSTGGSGFGPTSPYHYLDTLQSMASSILAQFGDANNVREIIVQGGSNDAGYGDTFGDIATAVKAFGAYVRNTYPKARVRIFFTGWSDVVSGGFSWERFKLAYSAYCSITEELGAVYDLHNIMHQHSLFDGDNIHPTVAAQYELAKAICNALSGADLKIKRTLDVSVTPDSGITLTGTIDLRFCQNDDVITAEIKPTNNWYLQKTFVASSVGGEFTSFKLGTISDWLIGTAPRGETRLISMCTISDGVNPAKAVPCTFLFSAGDVYMSIGEYNSTSTTYTINRPTQAKATFDSAEC